MNAEQSCVTSYIVRVYRRDRLAEEITGVVEIPGQDARAAFHNFAELKAILAAADVESRESGQ